MTKFKQANEVIQLDQTAVIYLRRADESVNRIRSATLLGKVN
ncbi:MAG: hypothetical protein WCK35_16845 [Chloroflexota bacterium]